MKNNTFLVVYYLDSEGDYHTGCWNISHYQQQQSPIQDYVHPDDHAQPTFEMTHGLKHFIILKMIIIIIIIIYYYYYYYYYYYCSVNDGDDDD